MSRTKKQPGPLCVWTLDSDQFGDSWDTACDHKHQFTDGSTPRDNDHAFCPYCGRQLVERRTR